MIRLLLIEALSTSQIAAALNLPLAYARDQLIRMHHLRHIDPVGIREEVGAARRVGYFADIVWTTTLHAREHREIVPGCWGCQIRDWLLAAAEAVLE